MAFGPYEHAGCNFDRVVCWNRVCGLCVGKYLLDRLMIGADSILNLRSYSIRLLTLFSLGLDFVLFGNLSHREEGGT